MSEKPYPDGVAWDEAWRERQRADRLEAALKKICDIELQMFGLDWDEIEEAQEIAREALENQYAE